MEQLTNSTLPTEGFVRISQVLSVFPYSRSKLWQMVKDGQFPKPTKISENISAWNVKTLRKKIEELESL